MICKLYVKSNANTVTHVSQSLRHTSTCIMHYLHVGDDIGRRLFLRLERCSNVCKVLDHLFGVLCLASTGLTTDNKHITSSQHVTHATCDIVNNSLCLVLIT